MASLLIPTHTCLQELEVVSADRNETVRLDNKHMLSALLLANTKKEKVGLERMMVLESSIRDIATATAGAMAQLQVSAARLAAFSSLVAMQGCA